MATSTGWYDLVPDVLGSTTLALNANGTVKAVQLFAPLGQAQYTDGTMPTSHNFTGQRLDDQTGLLYYNARYYDPASGSFTSADSAQNNTQGMNPYGYVAENPETNTDPTGKYILGPPVTKDGPPQTAFREPMGYTEVFSYESYGYYVGGGLIYHKPVTYINPYRYHYSSYDPLKDRNNSTSAKLGRATGWAHTHCCA
jgi:RHS repeat-associated protein